MSQNCWIRRGAVALCLTLLSAGLIRAAIVPRFDLRAEYETFTKEPRVALVIGVDRYARSGLDLKYSVADARSIAQVLADENGYKVELLLDAAVTRSGILSALRKSTAGMNGKGTFLFYFSGNGVMDRDGRQFLVLHDSDETNVRETGLDVNEVVAVLRGAGVRHKLVMLDACSMLSEGGVHRGLSMEPSPAVAAQVSGNVLAEQFAHTPGLFILNAASRGQASYEDDSLRHGVFTHFVIEGFRGQAADTNGLVSFLSLAEYVSRSVRDYSAHRGHNQTPYSAGEFGSEFILGGKLRAAPPPTPRAQPLTVPETADTRGGKRPEPSTPAAISRTGAAYALVIGINNYSSLKPLKTALNDAEAFAAELESDFGFNVEVLKDPGRAKILGALNNFRRALGPDDSLLIYYAGHGYFDADKLGKAYWLPADAEDNDTTNWIAADDITSNLKGTAARHVLIISDSCFSGALTRDPNIHLTGEAQNSRQKYLANVAKRKSRLLLASGGNEPVLDEGGDGKHSIFATVLLRSLKEMDADPVTVEELFSGVRESVAGRSSQVPECNPLKDSGHDGGTFIFEKKKAH